MKRKYTLLCNILLMLLVVAAGCKKDSKKPVSERIAKNWIAETVKHDKTVVFTRGGTTNTSDYSTFKLSLSSNGSATYNDAKISGISSGPFTGQWEVQGDNKLILKGLTPQPSGSGGTLEFNITSIEDSKLVLARTTTNPKTGATNTEYTLSL